MKDTEFKNLKHAIPKDSEIFSNGINICSNGNYRPDISIKYKGSNHIYLVIESENKSDRKAFIGAMIHACKFSYIQKEQLKLIFVMHETGNQTTVKQVSKNIKSYYDWIKELGNNHLSEILFISDLEYEKSLSKNEVILSESFTKRCTIL